MFESLFRIKPLPFDFDAEVARIIGMRGIFNALDVLTAKPSEEQQVSGKRNSENGADTFALLYGLRNAVFDVQDLSALGRERTINAICGDISHFTSEAIDGAASCMKKHTPATMPLEEIAEMARSSTRKFERSPDEIRKFKSTTDAFRARLLFSLTPQEEIVAHFRKAAGKNAADSLESYVAQAFSASSARSFKRFCTPLTRWWSSLQARMKTSF